MNYCCSATYDIRSFVNHVVFADRRAFATFHGATTVFVHSLFTESVTDVCLFKDHMVFLDRIQPTLEFVVR